MSPLVYISLLVLATLTYGQNTGRRGTNNVVIKLPALFGHGANTRVIVLPDPTSSRSSSSIRWTGEAKGPVAVDNQVTRRREPANRLGIQTRPNISPVGEPFIPQTQRQISPQETAGPNTRYQVYNQNSRKTNTRQNQQTNLQNQKQNINQQNNRQEPNRQTESQNQNQQSTDRPNQNRVSVTNRGSINNVATPPARTPRQPSPKESIFFNPESPQGGKPVVNPPNNRQTENNNPDQLANPSSVVRDRPNFVPAASLFVPAKNQGTSNLATNQGLNQPSQSQTTQQGTGNTEGSSPKPNNNKETPRGTSPNPNNPNKIQYVGNVNVGSVPAVNPQLLAGNAPDRGTEVNQPQQNNANERSGFPGQLVPRPGQTNNTPSMSQIDQWIAANFPELMNRNTGLPASPSLMNIRTRIETMTAGREVNPGPQPPNPATQAPPPTDRNVRQPAVPQNVKQTQNTRGTDNVGTNNQQQTNTRGAQGNGQQDNRLPGRIQLGTSRPPSGENPAVDAPPVNNPAVPRRPQTNFVQRENVNPTLQTNFLPNVNQIQGRTNLPLSPGINENTSNRGPTGREGGVLGNQNTMTNSNPSQGQTIPQGSGQFRPNNMPGDVQPNLPRISGNQNLGRNPGINQGFQQVPNGAADPQSQSGGTLPPQFRLNAGNPGEFNNQWMAGSPPVRPNPGSTNNLPSLPPQQGGMNMFNLLNRLPGSQNIPPRAFPVLPGNRGGFILPNPALLGNIPAATPEPTEAPEVEAGGVVEVEATPSPISNAAILNWAASMGNPLQNPNARGTNGPMGPNGRVNTLNPASGNWFDQLPRLPGWSNRQIDPFQQQPAANSRPPPSSNFPFQHQAPPNLANGGQTPSRSQRPTIQQRNPVQPQNQNWPVDQQAGPDQGPLGIKMRTRANQPTPPSQQPRNENARVQPAWKPPTAQPKPTNPPTRQTQNQATNRPSPKPVQGAWTPPVKQTTRGNTYRPSAPVNMNQPTGNRLPSRNLQGRQRPVNDPVKQPANQNRSSLQSAWQPPSSGQQQSGNINPAIPGQQQSLNGMGLFPNANMQGNNQGSPTLGGLPPHLANIAIHRRLLDQACGPSKIAQQNYQRQYMAFLGAQQRRRQAQMAMFQRQAGAAAQNPMFQQGVGGAAQNPLFPQGPGSSGQTANPGVRRKRQSPFFPMPGMSSVPGMQQMSGMAQFPGMSQMPGMAGMAGMAGMMPMVAPESPEINYQCTRSESCGMTTQERSQTVHRSPQAERDCQSRKTGLICCLG